MTVSATLVADLDEALRRYEDATNTHDFAQIAPLVDQDAVYWFSDGTHVGVEAIRRAFERAWATIGDEQYHLHDVQWLALGTETAACAYRFTWAGYIGGQRRQGGGRGTNVLARRDGVWRIVHEHLSPHPQQS
ncbi:nuclear transport factor 2 family protein [Catellatospora citrea]|uniref:YybH family protein n=1 Tax=Catellatospora citrea TaxID=53366 RepID=UPI0033D06C7A